MSHELSPYLVASEQDVREKYSKLGWFTPAGYPATWEYWNYERRKLLEQKINQRN